MKIGFVVPRYGVEVIGGAEYAARLLAERLVTVGHSCEVFTTCALDAATWANELAAGTTSEQGVSVHRFESKAGRGSAFAQCSAAVLGAPRRARRDDAMQWVEQLGPVCPDAVDAAAESGCDVVTFHPYMYHPTVTGIARLGRRSVLHPATHDEPAIHLPVYRDVFRDAAGLAFWTDVEQRTTSRIFPASVVTPQLVVGIGVEPGPDGVAPSAARARAGIGERPYLLCLGKVMHAKGSNALADAFLAYKHRNPGPLTLLYAGPIIDPLPIDPDIIALGPIDEDLKWALLRGTQALISPSALESLSLVLLEAWSVGSPVLVNAASDVTRDHCEQSGGGLWFDSYGMFEATVARLERDENLRAALGAAGRDYVERKYTWPQVIDRYTKFLQRVAHRAVA